MTECVRFEYEPMPAGLRAYATRDGESVTVRVAAGLSPDEQRRAVRKVLRAAHADAGPVPLLLPAGVPAITGAAAAAVRRFGLHPLTALAGSAVSALAAMIMTAALTTAPAPDGAGAYVPGPVPVFPAPHHHRRRPAPGTPGAGPAPSASARPDAAPGRAAQPRRRHSLSPAPAPSASATAAPPPSLRPSPGPSTSSPSGVPQPQPSPSPSPAQPSPSPGGGLCVRLPPLIGICVLRVSGAAA